jgi:hypothetical protein
VRSNPFWQANKCGQMLTVSGNACPWRRSCGTDSLNLSCAISQGGRGPGWWSEQGSPNRDAQLSRVCPWHSGSRGSRGSREPSACHNFCARPCNDRRWLRSCFAVQAPAQMYVDGSTTPRRWRRNPSCRWTAPCARRSTSSTAVPARFLTAAKLVATGTKPISKSGRTNRAATLPRVRVAARNERRCACPSATRRLPATMHAPSERPPRSNSWRRTKNSRRFPKQTL